ncbi:MAG: multidrug efflux MFS transporter [Clostridiales bacterium]|nr:multidrug efflux MFS transporter [Clostridiales bacterium]
MSKIVLTEKKRMLIFVNVVISCIACSMLATALSTALPPIVRNMNISVTTGQWLTSGYSLMMAITMPLTAFLVNRFPTKRLYCTAIMIFSIGLVICAVAPSFPLMMIGRLLQAAGNGMLTSMAQVITLTIFPAEKRGTAMGWYGMSVGAAPIIAPTIAGIMVDLVGWRMIFIASLVIMIIAFIYAIIVFEDVLDNVKKKFDVISFVMSALAFGGVTLGIGNIGSCGFTDIQVILPLIIGIIGSGLFVYRQLHMDEPFLELRTLSNKDYAVSVIGSMLLYFIMMGSSIVLPLYAQQTLGLSATISALMMLPGSALSAVISPYAGKIYDKIGIRSLFISGSVGLIISNALMIFINADMSVWIAAVINIVRNVSITCLMMPLVTWGASTVEKELTAHATALLTSLRTIAGAIGSAVFVAIMTMVADNSLEKYGANASMHGVNMTFLAMTITGIILILLALLGTSRKSEVKKV